MSEAKTGNELSFEERQERTKARRVELEPVLAGLAIKAKATYDLLRPKAQHVSTVERDHPLRHQQVHGISAGSIGGVVADYLMVAFGNHHDLTLYSNYTDGRDFRWQFERSLLLDDLLSERTKVEELAQPRSSVFGGGAMDIEVATYRYREKVGMNGQYVDGVCNYFNDFAEAEKYVESFEADLDEAVSRFS